MTYPPNAFSLLTSSSSSTFSSSSSFSSSFSSKSQQSWAYKQLVQHSEPKILEHSALDSLLRTLPNLKPIKIREGYSQQSIFRCCFLSVEFTEETMKGCCQTEVWKSKNTLRGLAILLEWKFKAVLQNLQEDFSYCCVVMCCFTVKPSQV